MGDVIKFPGGSDRTYSLVENSIEAWIMGQGLDQNMAEAARVTAKRVWKELSQYTYSATIHLDNVPHSEAQRVANEITALGNCVDSCMNGLRAQIMLLELELCVANNRLEAGGQT